MKNRFIMYGLMFAMCGFVGCGAISDEQALQEFRAACPKAKVYQHFVGEGDSDHAYMHFRYTEVGSEEKKEVTWVYQRQEDNTWKPIHKSDPKPPGSDFGN